MFGAGNPPQSWISYAIPAIVILIVLAFRLRRVNKARPLRIERLWILPAIYSVLVIILFVETPPEGIGWLLAAAGLMLGAALGWQRGRLMRIEVDPQTHKVSGTQSLAALLFIVGLILVRMGLRAAAANAGYGLHMSTATITDVLIAMALGFLSFQRLEIYLRAKRLLAAARGAGASGPDKLE